MSVNVFPVPASGETSINHLVVDNVSVSVPNGIYAAERFLVDNASLALTVNGFNLTGPTNLNVTNGSLNYDGVTFSWTTRTTGFGNTSIDALTFGNGLYVAGGLNGELRTSTDTITWTSRVSNLISVDTLLFADNLFIAGGSLGIVTSTDAITWTTRTVPSATYTALTFGNGIYVAAGTGGTLLTSTDAITWTTRTSEFGATNIRALAFGNGVYVACGDASQLRTSTNGITWTTRDPLQVTNAFLGAAFGNNTYLIVGLNGIARTSTDGITWTSQPTIGTTVNGAIFANGNFVVAQNGGQLRTSTDGITWTSRVSGTSLNLFGLTFGNNTYVVSGGSSSAPFMSVTGLDLRGPALPRGVTYKYLGPSTTIS
jgi:hypothetical protein